MEITSFRPEYLPQAAALFTENFKQQRQVVPALPSLMEDASCVADLLGGLHASCPGIAAVVDGKLLGYMLWFYVPRFRQTERKGAYCPEWGHAAVEAGKPAVYRAMYRAAAAQWAANGCQIHALSLLASDRTAEKVWFWNGFGLILVDAIRLLQPLHAPAPRDYHVRKAVRADVATLAVLEAEHWKHYGEPPVFMVMQNPSSAAELRDFLENPINSAWLAACGDELMGYIRFEGISTGAAKIVNSEDKIAITGAYIRPLYRGRGVASALLDAALQDYARLGFQRCSVDFESFNPEAAAFWMKYFDPVRLSVVRVPEK